MGCPRHHSYGELVQPHRRDPRLCRVRRQADGILMAAPAGGSVMPWPAGIVEAAMARGARVELALVHQGGIDPGSSAAWLKTLPVMLHHHMVEPADFGR